MSKNITDKKLREYLLYDPETGIFVWIKPTSRNKSFRVGSVAGTVNKRGYRVVELFRRKYQAHRLAWFYVHGFWPSNGIDHKDSGKDHNWIDNLREAAQSQNCGNIGRRKSCGLKGATFRKEYGLWQVTIAHRYVGMFPTEEAAHAAYMAEAVKYYGEFARAE